MSPKMQGLSWQSFKKNSMLAPLFIVIGLGGLGATSYILRLALRSPDVTWNTRENPEPWNEYKNKEYKFIKVHDRPNLSSPAPEY
ncbi:hypothetical protein K0M31_004819 [Melipona bicolor]|uniref:NADH dehydrogenase [ubiquinone] 1 alpha subcomplex subunit 4 n=1 Tax=Melipona bicolor TaxID=60889 RepID=A0AA40FVK5_9HYME|nr:hypothetical protein K0M31_004819 [Melipona bicolor]